MKYAIVRVPIIDKIFDYNKSIVCKYFDNDDDIINYVSEILPNYEAIGLDLANVNRYKMFRQLCPSDNYFLVNVSDKNIDIEPFTETAYNAYLKILKSIRLNKLKQIM